MVPDTRRGVHWYRQDLVLRVCWLGCILLVIYLVWVPSGVRRNYFSVPSWPHLSNQDVRELVQPHSLTEVKGYPSLDDINRWLDALTPSGLPKLGVVGGTLLSDSEMCRDSENDDVVAAIEQGVALLHSYWPFEAMRAFRYGIRRGGKCCSLYWGMGEFLLPRRSGP